METLGKQREQHRLGGKNTAGEIFDEGVIGCARGE